MPAAGYLAGDEPDPQPPREIPPWAAPFPGQGQPPRLPQRRPARFEAFDILRSGRPRMRLPDEITESQRLSEDVRGLAGVVVFGSAGAATVFGPDENPAPAAPRPGSGAPFDRTDLGGGGTRVEQLRALFNNEREFGRRLIGDIEDAAISGLDVAGSKGGKSFGEVLIGRVVQLAEGFGRAPGVEIGSNIFFGEAGSGEEAAIARQQAQEDALRATLNAVNGVAIRLLAPTRADPVALPGAVGYDDEQRDPTAEGAG